MPPVTDRCVLLNNQHQDRVDEFLAVHRAEPTRPVVFQPYTGKHLRAVARLLAASPGPVPVFLVAGNFGDSAQAVGLLHALEYLEETPPARLEELLGWISDYDGRIYATNLLTVTNLVPLRAPIPVRQFLKASDEQPLVPGRWPACVCQAPPLADVLAAL